MRDYPSFVRLVHDVYPRLHDRAFLEDHPLTRLLSTGTPMSPERLHRILIDAIEWLRPLGTGNPSSAERRRYSLLQLRYVEGATPERIARELQVSQRQARRDHVEALDEIARLLWTRLGRTNPLTAELSERERVPRVPSARRPVRPVSPPDSLDAEISSLNAAASVQPSDVRALIAGAVTTVSRLSEANGVNIAIAAPDPLESVVVNRAVLRQLLLHLLSEAIVRRPGGHIQIDVERRERALGIGITVADEGRTTLPTTEPFAADKPKSSVWPGVIEIITRLAESMNASIRHEARPDADTVLLSLPVGDTSTVLLVDDNPDVALLFRRYLAGTEYRLIQARSAERALRLARELRPDLVILDVLMPSHDGWEILQELRADSATAPLPVVICSVIPDHALAYSLGVTDFLSKPVTRPALMDLLARVKRAPVPAARGDPLGSTDTAPPRAGHLPG